jgi:hypothetical protein
MKNNMFMAAFVMTSCIAFICLISFAQEEVTQGTVVTDEVVVEEPVTGEVVVEESQFSSGTVSSVGLDALLVKEKDEIGSDVNVSYIVDSETQLVDKDTLADITAGEAVSVEYVVKDGQKLAKIINIKVAAAEEGTTFEMYDEKTSVPVEAEQAIE